MNTDAMKRVCVIGCGGAGKTTFSNILSRHTKLPLIHLDTLYWLPNWEEPNINAFKQIIEKTINKKSWILDGNFHNTMNKRFEKSDVIFWLDYSTWRCLFGVVHRLIKENGNASRPDLPNCCPERFDWGFIKYVYNFRRATRPIILQKLEQHAKQAKIIIFKNPKELQRWIDKNLC